MRHLELIEAEPQHMRQLVDQDLAGGANRAFKMMTGPQQFGLWKKSGRR